MPQNTDDFLFITQNIYKLIPDTFAHLIMMDVIVILYDFLLIFTVCQSNFHRYSSKYRTGFPVAWAYSISDLVLEPI